MEPRYPALQADSLLSKPPSGDLPNPGIEPMSPVSPALAGMFFTTSATREAPICLLCDFRWIEHEMQISKQMSIVCNNKLKWARIKVLYKNEDQDYYIKM